MHPVAYVRMYIEHALPVLLLTPWCVCVCLCVCVWAVVSGSRDSTLRVWDIETGECLKKLEGHVAAVRW